MTDALTEEMISDARRMASLRKTIRLGVGAVSAVLLTVGGFMADSNVFTFTASTAEYTGAVMVAAGLVLAAIDWRFKTDAERRRMLLNEYDERFGRALAADKDALRICAESLRRACGDDRRTRVTICGFDYKRNVLVPVVRISSNPEARRFGRNEYPIDRGFIGIVWDKGESSRSFIPARREAEYSAMGLSKDEIARLTMRPTSMVGARINGPRGDAAGVIVIENDSTERLNRFSLEPYMDVLSESEDRLRIIGSIVFDLRHSLDDLRECDPEGTQRTA